METHLFAISRRCVRRYRICLLYTSDAADERSSVDLGGRRIIKKKKHDRLAGAGQYDKQREHRPIASNE